MARDPNRRTAPPGSRRAALAVLLALMLVASACAEMPAFPPFFPPSPTPMALRVPQPTVPPAVPVTPDVTIATPEPADAGSTAPAGVGAQSVQNAAAPAAAAPVVTAAAPTGSATPSTTCRPGATFVADVTVPDGMPVAAGAQFSKVWRMRSSGCARWPDGTVLAYVSGDRMESLDGVPLPELAPGETTDITLVLVAPDAPGEHKGVWQLRGPDGKLFGDPATVIIRVPELQPTPTLEAGPASVIFNAERYSLRAGECTTVSWTIDEVKAVYFDGRGVTGHQSVTVCPQTTTSYRLEVEYPDGERADASLTITVVPVF